jgi:hypothetical protein
MIEESIYNFFSNVPAAAAFAYFAYLLWKRTDQTMTHYERQLETLTASIMPLLNRIDERTTRCHAAPAAEE